MDRFGKVSIGLNVLDMFGWACDKFACDSQTDCVTDNMSTTLSEKTQDRSCNVQGCTAVLVKLWEQSCQEASCSNTGSLNSNLAM